MRRSPVINMMIRAAEKAGRAVLRDFGEVEHLQASVKGPKDFVTIAGEKAERVLREDLQSARPRYGLAMGGSVETPGTDTSHRFIADPIDGTMNFMHGIPHFAVSVALEESREVIAGVVYNPVNDELFWAERNVGAYLHERRLRVSKRRRLDESLVAAPAYLSAKHDHADWATRTGNVADVATMRISGVASLNLAYVAAGRLDGAFDMAVEPWDLAAGVVILQEAGGLISDFDGGKKWLDTGNFVVAPPDLHGPLLKAIAKS